ncbi:unnamed protein product [Victoria cruziana]
MRSLGNNDEKVDWTAYLKNGDEKYMRSLGLLQF